MEHKFLHNLIKRHTSSGLVLPETLGKCTQLRPSSGPFQTNSKIGGQNVLCSPCTLTSDGGVNQKLYCYCKQPEDGMIACNNPHVLLSGLVRTIYRDSIV